MSSPADVPGRRVPLAVLNLNILGVEGKVEVPVPTGPSRLMELLPSAAAIANGASDLTVEHARRQGKEISCKAGCGACCRQLVMISVVEARALADLVDTMPPERQAVVRRRFADGVRRLEEVDILDRTEPRGDRGLIANDLGSWEATITDLSRRYFQLGIACPFLEEESCSIHPDRPMVCRGYHVTSPAEMCRTLYDVPVDRIEPPFHVGDLLGELADKCFGISRQMVPLVQSLEWSEVNGHRLEHTADGQELFGALMNELASTAGRPG